MLPTILSVTLLALVQAKAYMPIEQPIIAVVDSKLEIWIDTLQQCESGGNDKALNPKDTDGTPSKGRYQFKDKTFNWLSGKYKIATTSVWSGEEQELILRKMVYDKDINIRKQFPDCTTNPKVKNYAGLPPTELYGSNSS